MDAESSKLIALERHVRRRIAKRLGVEVTDPKVNDAYWEMIREQDPKMDHEYALPKLARRGV